jgi:ABC-type bacteriocin/lantibiotic exporter with double-glycine peptidase domain
MKRTTNNVWSHLYDIVRPHTKRFIVIVFIGLLSTGANIIEPLIYREAINDVAGLFVRQTRVNAEVKVDEDADPITEKVEQLLLPKEPHSKGRVAERTPRQAMETLMWAVALIFIVNVIAYALALLSENLNVTLASKVEQGFLYSTFIHVLRLPLSFFSKRSSAAISKQVNQSEEVSAVVTGFSQKILPEVISLVGILVVMFTQNVTLTLLSIAVIPFYLMIAFRSANKLEKSLSNYYERWEDVYARMQDALTGIKTVKLSGAEQREADELKKASGDAYVEYIKRTRLGNGYIFWESTLTQVSSALVLAYGGYLTLEHKLTPGDVVMFVSYLGRLYTPIDSLTTLWVNLQQNIAAISRAFKLLDSGIEEPKGADFEVKKGRVVFNDVRFQYGPDREILRGLNFTIEPGKITAIVGGSGAGKTTTVDLLMKLYEPSGGQILIDNEDLALQSPSTVRRQIGMVAADGAIFRGTLADNIRFKRPEASDEEVKTAAIAAGMENTIRRLPEGLDTMVGESGMGLSVGERQRIQIARVLASKPKILIMDEATANLDYATEAEIKRTVEQISKENTVIIIAHRYSMVQNADHVIVLSSGEIIEQGSPASLLEKGGWFSNFARSSNMEPESGSSTAVLEEDDDED